MVEERNRTVAIIFYFLVERKDILLNLGDAPAIPHLFIGRANNNKMELFLVVDLIINLDAERKLTIDQLQDLLIISLLLGEDLPIYITSLLPALRLSLFLLLLFVEPDQQVMLAAEHLEGVLEVGQKRSGHLTRHVEELEQFGGHEDGGFEDIIQPFLEGLGFVVLDVAGIDLAWSQKTVEFRQWMFGEVLRREYFLHSCV